MTQSSCAMVPDTSFDVLSSNRLHVRRFVQDDSVKFATYRSDSDVARYQGWDSPFSLEKARRFIASMTRAHPDFPGERFQFAIEERSSGALVGDLSVFTHREDPRFATVGVTLAPEAQGQGYATEGLALLLDYLLVMRGKHRVAAECDPRNTAVIALLERIGMRREAHHINSYWDADGWADEYVYALLAEEWGATRRRFSTE